MANNPDDERAKRAAATEGVLRAHGVPDSHPAGLQAARAALARPRAKAAETEEQNRYVREWVLTATPPRDATHYAFIACIPSQDALACPPGRPGSASERQARG